MTKPQKQYNALYILDLQGKEEGVGDAISALEKEIRTLGGQVRGVQKMDKRMFERVAGRLDSGYYVNLELLIAPDQLLPLQQKFKSNPLVYRQHYFVANPNAVAERPEAPARPAATAAA